MLRFTSKWNHGLVFLKNTYEKTTLKKQNYLSVNQYKQTYLYFNIYEIYNLIITFRSVLLISFEKREKRAINMTSTKTKNKSKKKDRWLVEEWSVPLNLCFSYKNDKIKLN